MTNIDEMLIQPPPRWAAWIGAVWIWSLLSPLIGFAGALPLSASSLSAYSKPHKRPQGHKNSIHPGGTLMDARQAVAAHKAHVDFHVGEARFELVRIPAGHFEMGSPQREQGHDPSESPVRRIHISQAFYLGKYEVTQAQYRAVMGMLEMSDYHGDSYPMDSVPNAHAVTFCQKLSHLTGLHVVLPTEAQWEYACRAGTRTRFYTGDSEAALARAGWYRGNSGKHLHEVGQKEPNAFGLYDMLGNVGEMCEDEIGDHETMAATDPKGSVTSYRTSLRGGAWMFPAEDCRCAAQTVANGMMPSPGQGFRIAVIP